MIAIYIFVLLISTGLFFLLHKMIFWQRLTISIIVLIILSIIATVFISKIEDRPVGEYELIDINKW